MPKNVFRNVCPSSSALSPASILSELLTHCYILGKDPPPECEHCQCIWTVHHILVECNQFAEKRKDIFGKRDVVELFRFNPTLILLYLKESVL